MKRAASMTMRLPIVVAIVLICSLWTCEGAGRQLGMLETTMASAAAADVTRDCMQAVGEAVSSSCRVSMFGSVDETPGDGCCEAVNAAIDANSCGPALSFFPPYANRMFANSLSACHIFP
ncbi:hypothetical protein KP509_18G030700 [Ceratopteris richardii]|uniref:Bifunctional inhibitor/plant lipid transfer protein/seed storage helical domain-containing protein n=1 Tax=Ceratopteris richardii TaxID=49495 RepID=A0A8T2SQL9_CERRI|nr:hypothetical protein KP509_18G030700 [Ceratopteris richardii]